MKVNIESPVQENRVVSVQIEPWDTWNADHTLSLVVLPLLNKLREHKNGSPTVDDADVPEALRSSSAAPVSEYDTDSNFHKRWEWVLGEMIFAMQEISTFKEAELRFYEMPAFDENDEMQIDNSSHLMKKLAKMKVDYEGLKKYNDRIDNGCILFGKYFQSLWS